MQDRVTDLKTQFDREIDLLCERFARFQFEDSYTYGLWLAQTCYLVKHTTRLLGLVAGHFGTEQESLHALALDGLREERGHDRLAENDLKQLGYNLSDFPELAQASAIYQSQYYRVQFTPPVSLFGYALMLEGLSAKIGQSLTQKLANAHGPRAASFMRVHGVHDCDHYVEGLEALKGISEQEAAGIVANLLQSRVLYSTMMDAVEAAAATTVPAHKKSA